MVITIDTRLLAFTFCDTFQSNIPVFYLLVFFTLLCIFNQNTYAQELDSNTNFIRIEDRNIINETRREEFDINNRSSNPQEEQGVRLIPSSTGVHTGGQITLRAELNYEDQSASYRFSLEGSNWYRGFQREKEVIFNQFENEGIYHFFVEVKVFGIDEPLVDECRVVAKYEEIVEPIQINLEVDRTIAKVGDVVKFEAFVNSDRKDLLYHFNFGDDSPTDPSFDRRTSHSYRSPGRYQVMVKLYTIAGQILDNSDPVLITIHKDEKPSPPPPSQTSDWWKYIMIIVVSIITAGYATWLFFKLRITLHPHPDPGNQSFEKQNELGIDIKFKLNSNLSNAKYQLDTHGKKFITSIRRKK